MTVQDVPGAVAARTSTADVVDPAERFVAVVESCLRQLGGMAERLPGERLAFAVGEVAAALGKGHCVAALDAGELMVYQRRWLPDTEPAPGMVDYADQGMVAMPEGSAALLGHPRIDEVLASGSLVVSAGEEGDLGEMVAELGLDHTILAGGPDVEGRRWVCAVFGRHPVVEPYAARIALTSVVHVALNAPLARQPLG